MNDTKVADVTTLKKAAIVKSLDGGSYLTKAAEAAGISVRTVYRWREDDADFDSQIQAALTARIAVVEDSVYSKAVGGNVTAQIFFLCNRAPGKWRSVTHIQHSGGMDVTHKADIAQLVEAARNNGHGIGQRVEDRGAFLGRRGLTTDSN